MTLDKMIGPSYRRDDDCTEPLPLEDDVTIDECTYKQFNSESASDERWKMGMLIAGLGIATTCAYAITAEIRENGLPIKDFHYNDIENMRNVAEFWYNVGAQSIKGILVSIAAGCFYAEED